MTDQELYKPVDTHLKEFHNYFKNQMRSGRVSLLDLIIGHIAKSKGKRVRPALVFLTAELCGGINDRTYVGAALVEFLHTATLIHDDVVDESNLRRGLPTVNSSYGNKNAVLFGDYLLAKGLLTAIDNEEFEFLKASSLAVKRMSEGELLQIQKSREGDINEQTYFKIISDKTGSLMASCCEIGAISSNDDKSIQEMMRNFGEYLGIAFQIQDDIFDYLGKSLVIGKPVGNDLKEKKFTLPLIYSFKKSAPDQSEDIIRQVSNGNLRKKDIKRILNFVNTNGGLEYATGIAKSYSDKAIAILDNFPDCPAKKSLAELARYFIERKK
jgi:octaprenyl-diphosphate synthase